MSYNNNNGYNNNRNNGSNNYNGGNNFNRGGNGGNGNNSNQPKKHSGAKHRTYLNSEGTTKYLTTGWIYRKRTGLCAIKCVTTKHTKLTEKGWFTGIRVQMVNTETGEENLHWGVMQKNTGKVVVSALNMVINPRAKNGGYAGSFLGN